MQSRQIKLVLALLGFAAAGAILYFRYFHDAPKVDPAPHRGLGEALAEQAAKIPGGGGRIVLIAPDTVTFKYPAAQIQLKAFHQSLRRANLTLAATNRIKLDPLRPARVQPGDLVEILRKYSDNDVVVSLLSPSALSAEHKTRLGEKRPRFIAVCTGDTPRQVNLKTLFAENMLHAAIVSRAAPGMTPPASDNPKDWFNHYFQWATPQSAGELPEPGLK